LLPRVLATGRFWRKAAGHAHENTQTKQHVQLPTPKSAMTNAGDEIDYSSSAICAGPSVPSSTNPETDTPSSLTAFFIGKSALNNSAVTFAKSLRCPTEPATVVSLQARRTTTPNQILRNGSIEERPWREELISWACRAWRGLRSSAPKPLKAPRRGCAHPSEYPQAMRQLFPYASQPPRP
jgi:hypothetical protein